MWIRVGTGTEVDAVTVRSVAEGFKMLSSGEAFTGRRIGGVLSGNCTGADLLRAAIIRGVLPDVVQVEHVGRSMLVQMRAILEDAGYVTQDGGFYFIKRV